MSSVYNNTHVSKSIHAIDICIILSTCIKKYTAICPMYTKVYSQMNGIHFPAPDEMSENESEVRFKTILYGVFLFLIYFIY